ncbi:hypothetical protein QWY81_17825 [Polaribacter undariae]|uniref:Uncharacterized protein n=1 Tax=Polaribacter sejongensis TaxID=985043 RepID=A0AAJ1R2S4_9FLAO|nr:hypothetical protein [Polaribacter undariae]MDN3621331.1 hypothetical protein [Polaribacter undariae]UWD31873.1 hypothetical protein NQP51_17290 [Polaribacter undariae]
MDISKYTKLIDKIARNLKNGKLLVKDIKEFAEKELGHKLYTTLGVGEKTLSEMEIEQESDRFFTDNFELISNFKFLITMFSRAPIDRDAFSIKHSSFQIVDAYNILSKYKDSELYDQILVFTISNLREGFPDIEITSEMVKALKKKYLN